MEGKEDTQVRLKHAVVSGRIHCALWGTQDVEACFYCPFVESIDLDSVRHPNIICQIPKMRDVRFKTAYERMGVLQLAKSLGNVSEACRRTGVSRKQFYRFKKRYEASGLKGLVPRKVRRPNTSVSPDVENAITKLSLEHPGWGATRLKDTLNREGIRVGQPTVQRVLKQHGMTNEEERVRMVESLVIHNGDGPTPEQAALIERFNPAFRERSHPARYPGQNLVQFILTFHRNAPSSAGLVGWYLEAVIDTFSGYAFATMLPHRSPGHSIRLLHYQVFPFFHTQNLQVETIFTNSSRIYSGTDDHPYDAYLASNHVKHELRRGMHGFSMSFRRIIRSEFLRDLAVYRHDTDELQTVQMKLEKWMQHFNQERRLEGYPNPGKTPMETVQEFVLGRGQHSLFENGRLHVSTK